MARKISADKILGLLATPIFEKKKVYVIEPIKAKNGKRLLLGRGNTFIGSAFCNGERVRVVGGNKRLEFDSIEDMYKHLIVLT